MQDLQQDINLGLNVKQDVDLIELNKSAEQLIAKSTAKASAMAAVPVPLIDIGGVTYIQLNMVKEIAMLYGVDTENQNKLWLSTIMATLCGSLVSEAISSITAATQLEKILSESLIKASIAGLLTTVTGEVYQEHFARGGNIEDISVDTYIEYVRAQLKSDRISTEMLGSKIVDSALSKFGI